MAARFKKIRNKIYKILLTKKKKISLWERN